MSQQAASRTQIHPCDPSHRNLAFELLLREFPPEERASLVERLATTTHPAQLSGLLGAYRANQLCGIVWAQCQPGNTAVLWPPQLFEQDASATADALLDAALDHCLAGNTRLVQSMLSTDSSSTASLLRRHGFTHLADLLYLVAHRLQFPDSPPAPDLEFESFQESQYSRFAQLIESTYLHSLDCPALDGVRPLDDVLNGYRNTGEFSPSRWLFVRQSYCDVGCLLLADHPADDQWELVYMGVAPAVRGRGLGASIARHAQWLTNLAGRSRLVLAVDAENRPAVDTYAEAGFIAWDRRSVFIRRFASAQPGAVGNSKSAPTSGAATDETH